MTALIAQPLDQVYPDVKVIMTEGAITSRPEHAVLIARVISSWVFIEASIGNLLTLFLDSNAAGPVVAIYLSLDNTSKKIEAVRSVARAIFSGSDLAIADGIFNKVSNWAQERNMIAHSLWGYLEGIDDAIVAIPPQRNMLDNFASVANPTVLAQLSQKVRKTRQDMLLYRKADLIKIIEEIENLFPYIYNLVDLLKGNSQARTQLSSLPEVQSALSKMSPSTPVSSP